MMTGTPLPRDHWLRRLGTLDAEADHEQVYGITVRHEFPWDMNQALSFALFRTYAVPSIGVLLHGTGEFTEHTQKRYDDTALILDLARAALRARGAWLRRQPPRLAPLHAREVGNVRGYPDGYDVAGLGTFERSGRLSGCPAPHA